MKVSIRFICIYISNFIKTYAKRLVSRIPKIAASTEYFMASKIEGRNGEKCKKYHMSKFSNMCLFLQNVLDQVVLYF
jgi:hypothetical protein